MSRLILRATGPAPAEVAWRRYADTRLWTTWSPQIRRVELDQDQDQDQGQDQPDGVDDAERGIDDGCNDAGYRGNQLRPGLTGRVVGPIGVSIRFAVDAVDTAAMTWSWRVHAGPITLRLHHTVLTTTGGSSTTLTIEGAAPVVLGYAPLAQLALHQLVRP